MMETFLQETPDLVLLDVLLLEKDWFTLCEEITLWAGVPIVMMTGPDDVELISKTYGAGATDFIVKPMLEKRLRKETVKCC